MATRMKPEGCCAPIAVKPLPKRKVKRVAMIAKALSDPTRIEVLRLLAQQAGPVCACDIVDHFDLSQPTVSHHLKTLKEAGLLRGSRSGLWVIYEIAAGSDDLLVDFSRLLE